MGVLDELDKQDRAGEGSVLGTLDRVPVAAHYRRPRGHLGASIGGMTAGAIASPLGPASIPIAGAGGAVGEAFQQGLEAVPPTSGLNPVGQALAGLALGGANPQEIALQGAQQAGLQSIGGMAGLGAKALSKPMMELAVKATPEVAQTAIREGINTTRAGFGKLMTKLGQYGARTENIVKAASRAGKPMDLIGLVKQAYQEVYPKVATSMTGDEAAALKESVQRFVGQNGNASVTPLKLHKLKQAADTAARAIYALPEGARPTPGQQAVAGFYKTFADNARGALNKSIAGYEASNQPTEDLIKLKDALRPLTKKEMSTAAQLLHATSRPLGGAAIGAGIGAATPGNRAENAAIGAGLGALAGTPTAMSNLSLGLNSPLLQLLLQRLIPGVGNAVVQ